MQRIFLTLTGIAVVLILITGAGIYWFAAADIGRAKEDAAVAAANGVAMELGAGIEQLQQAVNKMAQDAEVVEALIRAEPTLINLMESRLEKYLPGAMAIRLLTPDINTLDTSRIPQMGYADLDMVRETLNGPQMPAIQGDEGENRHLAITAPVTAGANKVGVLLASLRYDFIDRAIKPSLLRDQYLQLMQSKLELAAAGDRGLRGDGEQIDIKVPGTVWVVRAWYTGAGSFSDLSLITGTVILTGSLAVLAFFVGYRKMAEILNLDQRSVLKAAKDVLTGNAYGNYPTILNEMSIIISTLMQYKRALGNQEAVMEAGLSRDSEFDGFFEESNFALDELTRDIKFGNDKTENSKPDDSETKPKGLPRQQIRPVPGQERAPAEIFKTYDIRGIVGE
ncbi:MAG: phosphomannomutase/phosphoglucomutase, partial [Gammaproteobacteria bacterium]